MPSPNEPAEAVAVGRFLSAAVVVILIIAVLYHMNKNNDQSSTIAQAENIDVHTADVDVKP